MPRTLAIASVMCFALLIANPAHPERLHKGQTLVAIGLTGHRGQFVGVGKVISNPSFYGTTEVGVTCSPDSAQRFAQSTAFAIVRAYSLGDRPPSALCGRTSL